MVNLSNYLCRGGINLFRSGSVSGDRWLTRILVAPTFTSTFLIDLKKATNDEVSSVETTPLT